MDRNLRSSWTGCCRLLPQHGSTPAVNVIFYFGRSKRLIFLRFQWHPLCLFRTVRIVVRPFQNFLGAVRTKSRIVEERFELEQFVFCDVQRGRQHRHSVLSSEILNNKLTNVAKLETFRWLFPLLEIREDVKKMLVFAKRNKVQSDVEK